MRPDTPPGIPVTEQPSGVRAIRLAMLAVMVGVTIFTASTIARVTRYAVHPDETEHVDAICYYAAHVWPPDINADGLLYSISGWSRVYNSEIVYLVYGRVLRASTFLMRDAPPAPIPGLAARSERLYLPLVSTGIAYACSLPLDHVLRVSRSLNVLLLLATLTLLLLAGRWHIWTGLAALLVMSLPQVVYIYAYANSDAWGLSVSLFLIAWVLVRGARLIAAWWSIVALAVLTGLVLLSKETFWIAIPFAYLMAGLALRGSVVQGRRTSARGLTGALVLIVVISLIMVAPIRVYYPRTQGDLAAGIVQMREQRAMPGYKPGMATAEGYLLAQRGVPFSFVSRDLWWYERTAQSIYGVFAWMDVEASSGARQAAGAAFALLASATYVFAVLRWRILPGSVRVGLIVAPLCVALALLMSLLNSWRVDVQPQGRYLLGALMPAAIIMAGTLALEPRWLRNGRTLLFVWLFLWCQVVLWTIVIGNPALTG